MIPSQKRELFPCRWGRRRFLQSQPDLRVARGAGAKEIEDEYYKCCADGERKIACETPPREVVGEGWLVWWLTKHRRGGGNEVGDGVGVVTMPLLLSIDEAAG